MAPEVHSATLPPGLRMRAAAGQNPDMLNQCAALEAVIRSTLESAMGGVRSEPRLSAVEISKRMSRGGEGSLVSSCERAMVIIPSEGSRPIAWVKWWARA